VLCNLYNLDRAVKFRKKYLLAKCSITYRVETALLNKFRNKYQLAKYSVTHTVETAPLIQEEIFISLRL